MLIFPAGLDGSGGAGQPMPALRQHNAYPQTGRMQAQVSFSHAVHNAVLASVVWSVVMVIMHGQLACFGISLTQVGARSPCVCYKVDPHGPQPLS